MKKIIPLTLTALLLTSCGSHDAEPHVQPSEPHDVSRVLATTYPVYLFTTAITDGVDGIDVSLMINEAVSCLHDYTLAPADMIAIEQATVIVQNGADFESFMDDALSASSMPVIQASFDLDLIESEPVTHGSGIFAHTHDGDYDPHVWLSTANAEIMLSTIADCFMVMDPTNAEIYAANLNYALDAVATIPSFPELEGAPLITFHDGFKYLARDTGLNLLKSIEEEPGAEASASDINEIISLINEYEIPVIFTEMFGSEATAGAIARETGVDMKKLTMLMSGNDYGIEPYVAAMTYNLSTLAGALS